MDCVSDILPATAYLHEVVIVGDLPALPSQLQPGSCFQLALPVHDHNPASDVVYAVYHISHDLHSSADVRLQESVTLAP